jgi:hypothetical protein
MRKLLPVVFGGLALISYAALAADPVKPEIGAGPHMDRSAQTSGAGDTKQDPSQPGAAGQPPGGGAGAGAGPQGSGAASAGPSRPDAVQDQDDERKATQAKEKMKKKPGYREDVPSPRAEHMGLMTN